MGQEQASGLSTVQRREFFRGKKISDSHERPPYGTVRITNLQRKVDLPLLQAVADAFTQARLGTYKFTEAEEQTIPNTEKRLDGNSPFVAVTYTGPEKREGLLRVFANARDVKHEAERARKPEAEIEANVRDVITTGIESERKKNSS